MPAPAHRTTRLQPWARALLTAGTALGISLVTVAPGYAASSPSTGVAAASAHSTAGGDAFLDHDLELREVRLQRRLIEARTALDTAQARRQMLDDRLVELQSQAATASQRAEDLRGRLDGGSGDGLFGTIADFFTGEASDTDLAVEAVGDEQHALGLVAIAEDGIAEADVIAKTAERDLAEVQVKVDRLEKRSAAQIFARDAAATAEFASGYDVSDPVQDRRNRRALEHWQHYLIDLGNAGVMPPKARKLQDPDDLRSPFGVLRDRRGRAVAGAAQVETKNGGHLPVLPVETIHAVSRSFGLVGLPPSALGVDAWAFTCGGLAARAWHDGPVVQDGPVAEDASVQWQQLRHVPTAQRQAGDLVYSAGEPADAAIAIGADLSISADPLTGVAAVVTTDEDALGARRPSLETGRARRQAKPAPFTCAAPVAPVAPMTPTAPAMTSGAGWTWPVDAGLYQLSAGFGTGGSLWSSGQHTGQDFAAPVGTPVRAARPGTVHVEHPGWAGNLVRIDHGDGSETLYAHLSRVDVIEGQVVEAGEPIGAVGSEGNSTGPHLHFEVRIGGRAIDPMPVLTGIAASPAPVVAGEPEASDR